LDENAKHIEALNKDGYTLIPDAISADEVARTNAAIDDILAREEPIARRTTTQTTNLKSAHAIVGKHPHFYEFFLNPPVLNLMRAVLGEDVLLYDMNARVVLPTGGRETRRGFQVHVDREDFSVNPFADGKHYPMALNVIWCLVDFTLENGATLMWPGSHLSGQVPDPEGDFPNYVRAIAPAGTALIWDAALWHATGLNVSGMERYSLTAFYQRPWIKGKTDSARLLPPEARAAMSDEARRVLGLQTAPSDYSEVKALTPEQIAALTIEEQKVLGFAVY
jgi:ectoine hydroxylase-related dioxygenase (phytanoyl-CoA dioxygenase family)